MAEAGKIVLVRTTHGSNDWINEFLAQAEAFPATGAHDDLIDALSIAFEYATVHIIRPHVWVPGDYDYDGPSPQECDEEIRQLIDGCRDPEELREMINELKRDELWTPAEGWRAFEREAFEHERADSRGEAAGK